MTREPVAFNTALGGVLATGVALAALLWPGLTPAMQAAVIAFGNSVILLAVIVITRMHVTPTEAPALERDTDVTVLQDGQPTGYVAKIV